MTSIIIVDQTEIPSTFNCLSLFVNGIHILDDNDGRDTQLEEISKSLSTALDTKINTVKITEKELAIAVSKKLGKYDELKKEIESGKVNYEKWTDQHNKEIIFELSQISV